MLKILAILAVASGLTVANPHQKDGSTAAKQSKGQDTGSPAVSFVCNQTAAPDAKTANNEPPHWYRSPEWWLCILGVPTLYFIARQTGATRKAVEVSRDSIRLQEMAYIQWVDLANWQVTFDEERQEMKIQVEILNQTEFPLTLNHASLVFGDKPNIMTATLGQDFFLAPKLPYVINVGLHVYNDQIRAFDSGYYGIMVNGSITHVGVLRRPLTQDIGGILVAGKGNPARFDAFVPMHPKSAQTIENA